MVVLSSTSTNKISLTILHQVPEGHVGVYWRGGALLKTITDPGVRNIPCGTKGGVMINFNRIEVVNRLNKDAVYDTLLNYGVHYDKTWIYDKIHHEINQFCSSHALQQVYIDMFDQIDERMKDALQGDCTRYAPGVEIISVRVTKPTIPESIRHNYEQMEEERTKIIMEQKLMEKESARSQQQIDNEMNLAREKSMADAYYYRLVKEAEANTLKLTPQYLELRFIEAIANNTKMYFGDKIPNMVFDQKLLGNFLESVAKMPRKEAF
uniref:Band 7 domain-containing protein n=1 Tax=Chenopodium quinoa TaxID=63459 RepID=A0A803L7T2_CHEQI